MCSAIRTSSSGCPAFWASALAHEKRPCDDGGPQSRFARPEMQGVAATTEPVFRLEDELWSPAAGPFGGLHGGAVSGLIVARFEAEARRQGARIALSASVLLLRPAPMSPL